MNDITIDLNFINKISSRLEGFSLVRKNVWNCRCPVCGDSKKNRFKKRFYFFLNDDVYSVKCHNCGYASSFSKFLEIYYPEDYRNYIFEKFPNKSTLSKDRFSHVKDVVPKKVHCNGFDYSFLKRFDELSEIHPARLYVEARNIPMDRVFYAPHFNKVIEELGLDIYKSAYEKADEPRMIIPFYREDGLSTVFQARSFVKDERLRYITIKEDEGESKIYGLERIDKTLPVWCFEGPIDSMMIPNSIAMSGISTKLPKGISEFRFVFDNEPRNADVVKNMRKRLISGYRVVIFPDRIQYKDINDMIVKGGIPSQSIIQMLNDNVYDKEIGLLKLNEWCKIKKG